MNVTISKSNIKQLLMHFWTVRVVAQTKHIH